jgi:hypothetical protein
MLFSDSYFAVCERVFAFLGQLFLLFPERLMRAFTISRTPGYRKAYLATNPAVHFDS